METVSQSYSFGFFFGLLLSVAICILVGLALRRRLGRQEYDERQRRAQGTAYKWAYYTLMGYLCIGGVFDLGTGLRWCDRFTFVFLGLLASLLVFSSICIVKDAYMPFSQNAVRTIWMLAAIGAVNLVIGIVNLLEPGLVIVDGVLTHRCVNLLCGILLLSIALTVWIKTSIDKRRAADEK